VVAVSLKNENDIMPNIGLLIYQHQAAVAAGIVYPALNDGLGDGKAYVFLIV
jgi:hypothetical protein